MTFRSILLAGAMLAGATGAANAVTGVTFPTQGGTSSYTVTGTAVFGGGSSLVAPYFRQAADCYGQQIDLVFQKNPTPKSIAPFNYTGTPAYNCANNPVSPGNVVSYVSTGSGRGILGFFAHSAFYQDPVGQTGDAWTTGTGYPVYGTKVNFAASDAGLPQTDPNQGGDVDAYNGTGVDSTGAPSGRYVSQSGTLLSILNSSGQAPDANVTVPSGTPSKGNPFPNPRNTYGRMIQIPVLIAVADIAFDPIYKKTTNASTGVITNTSFTHKTSGTTKLTNKQLCYIFNGYAKNLGATDVNGTSLGLGTAFGIATGDNPANVPIQIVGRSDGSGTTSIVYRHLEAVCSSNLDGQQNLFAVDPNTVDANGNHTIAPTTLPSGLTGAGSYSKTGITNKSQLQTNFAAQGNNTAPGEVAGKFTVANGSDGVAEYLANISTPASGATVYQLRIGYVGNDYVLPYVLVNNQNNFGLIAAALQNAKGAEVAPTPASATLAFTGILPPQTTSAGAFTTAPNTGSRANPASLTSANYFWTAAASTLSPLANPPATGAYPLVGTTNALFYQCYADLGEASVIRGFLNWYYTSKIGTDAAKGILAQNGLAPVTKPYQLAITQTFISNPVNTGVGKLNLDIQQVSVQPECTGVSTGA